jgi:hypothetical protein
VFASDLACLRANARARAESDYLWQNTLPRLVARYAELARAKGSDVPLADIAMRGIDIGERAVEAT